MSSLSPLRVAKRGRYEAKQVVLFPGHDVVWLPGLASKSMESSKADWRATNGQMTTNDAPDKPKVRACDVPDMEDLAFLLEKDAKWTQDVGFLIHILLRSEGNIAVTLWRPNWRLPVVLLMLLRSIASCWRRMLILGSVLIGTDLVHGGTDDE